MTMHGFVTPRFVVFTLSLISSLKLAATVDLCHALLTRPMAGVGSSRWPSIVLRATGTILLSVCLFACLLVCLLACLRVYVSMCLSVCLPVSLSGYQFVCLPDSLSACQSVCLSVCTFE